MSGASPALAERIAARLSATVDPAVADFARALADAAGARAVLFYGSNLRTGSLEGVLDFYILLPGTNESAIWPTVSYHERDHHGVTLRAKVATMRLATFAKAAGGELTDTTIWARFVQPSALIWAEDNAAKDDVIAAIASAATTAARLAAALGLPPAETAHGILQVATAIDGIHAGRRQQAPLHGEEVDEQETEPEGRHRDPSQYDEGDRPVRPAELPDSRDDAGEKTEFHGTS